MSKFLRTIRVVFTPNLCLVGIVLGVVAFLLATIPAAHAATLPPPPKQPEVKLYVYPKLLPPQQGEVIIRTRPDPETIDRSNPFERPLDTQTWA